MELFEEALRRWEQALTFRSRQAEDEASCGSVKLGAGDAIAEESVEVSARRAVELELRGAMASLGYFRRFLSNG